MAELSKQSRHDMNTNELARYVGDKDDPESRWINHNETVLIVRDHACGDLSIVETARASAYL